MSKVSEIDDYIAKLQRRIEKMKNNPDPNRPMSNLYRYEITLSEAQKRKQAWEEERPFCDGGSPFMIAILTNAMGFANTAFLESTFNTRNSVEYIRLAGKNGLPVDSACDMSILPLSMNELGMIPPEDCTLCDNHACTPMLLRTYYAAYKSQKQCFTFDIPLDLTYESIVYVTEQLKEFIEYCEHNFQGIHYDEERLARDLDLQEEYEKISCATYELLKAKPCPMSGLDILSFMAGAGLGGDVEKRVHLAKMRYEEIKERVDKGIGPVQNEKLRFMWTITRPFFMDPFKVLHEKGISVPMYFACGPLAHAIPLPNVHFWGDRTLTTLERVAARAMLDRYGHYGKTWVDDIIWVCKDLQLDGIVNYAMVGCTATLGLKKMISDRVEEELGIPVLHLDAREWDSEYASEEEITAQLNDFADMCLARKGLL